MAMDDTTLHTFLFHCPAALRNIVLLGSWDNFNKPYPLELDVRRGRNLWRGCFTFSDIICDGDLKDPSPKRNGLLKMGGTYWYYFKVDGDEECHNPAEPSTTFCPLLPGQRLNVLDIPSEGHSRSSSEPSGGFTRNPTDRYLNPVPPAPPKAAPSPLLQPSESHAMPSPSPWAPHSATYPPSAFLSPNVVRHARSASASPNMPSTPLFADFRVLKDKLVSRRSAYRSRSSSRSQDLNIGTPVLISTTNKELNLVPLASYQPPPVDVSRDRPHVRISDDRPVPTIKREFSPLSSHPVDLIRDPVFAQAGFEAAQRPQIERRRSHVPSTVITSEFKLARNRNRANSADTRRTQHYLFSNDPWLSSPRSPQLEENFEGSLQPDATLPLMPVLQRPSASLAPPTDHERPTSSHGHSRSPSLRQVALDKELPELPRYVTPAPLFACHNTEDVVEESLEDLLSEEEEDDEENDRVLDHFLMHYEQKPRSHFSTWSEDSLAMSFATSEDEAVLSPTFSSFNSDFSDADSPRRCSMRFSHAFTADTQRTSTLFSEDLSPPPDATPKIHFTTTPPQLDDLHISTFGSDLFNLDIQHADAAPRRQAACFGLGFHYSLPEDETTSKTTITEQTSDLESALSVQRGSSVSQLTRLMDDFGYLGDAVI